MSEKAGPEPSGFWSMISDQLKKHGVDLEMLTTGDICKVVCVPTTLGASAEEMGKAARDQVLMVRIDKKTIAKLDAWIETGAAKSRSEAAALFIREGLKVRESELVDLEEALQDVEAAKERLRKKAHTVLGKEDLNSREEEPSGE